MVALLTHKCGPKVKRTHLWRRRLAKRMFKDLCAPPPAPALLFKRVRSMDALAFEELVMEAFGKRNLQVRRSASYSGDGGQDGEVKIKGEWHLLQMKRYQGNITPEHVRAFDALCQRTGRKGVFVHTGKTTPASRDALQLAPGLSLNSGDNLYHLLTGQSFDLKTYD